jgi:NADH-quinone oxidoreductase subunit N
VALLPEIVLAAAGLAVFGALMAGVRRATLARWIAQGGAVLLLAACLATVGAEEEFFSATYRVDAFSQLVKAAVALGFALALFVTAAARGQRDDARAETWFFLLTSTAGLVVMASAVEAVALYLALEIASFSLFVLVPLREGDGRGAGKEAGLKFLVVGLAASAVTLLGLSILIGLTGTTMLRAMGAALPGLAASPVVLLGLALFTAGFLFKVAVFPFHFWAPDVYQAASHGVASFVATASKVAGVAILARLLAAGSFAGAPLAAALALAAAISMTLGNLVAIQQRDIKRMLAYSAVAQAGYIVVGLVAFSAAGLAAALLYGVLYVLMNAAAFLVVARVAPNGANPSLDDLRGLHRRSPLLAATLLLALFALAGVPPTAGFAGKWLLFRAAVDQGWWWLVLLAAVNSTISIYYYLIAVKHAYLLPAEPEARLELSPADRAVCFALCGGLLLLGIWPARLLEWSERAAQSLLR